ncbi:MAG: NAD(P)/FAD-dependent oxidoreductase [Bacteroidia bacterium]
MVQVLDLIVAPQIAFDELQLRNYLTEYFGINDTELSGWRLLRRSVDARNRNIKVNLRLEVFVNEPVPDQLPAWPLNDVSKRPEVHIIGAGPAGLFAALRLIELNLKPVILERGKDVQRRRRDLATLNKEHIVNPDSNYCFGEGGAGTYSDGKLYTRSGKRGDINRILELFVAHGADPIILADAHPHIGTNRLPKIIVAMRDNIRACGGEVHFDTKVTGIERKDDSITALIAEQNGSEVRFAAKQIILATGHSARDIFELLHSNNIRIEAKPFAMGVRAEHPQALIDSVQYHCSTDKVPLVREYLPASAYSLVQQVNGLGVYSFCMCPGGIIAPCATGPEQVVTNGWSPSRRNNPYANSGIVVAVDPAALKQYEKHGPFAALRYQQTLERIAWEAGGKTQTAPAQALSDFVNGKLSSRLPDCSYQPGVVSAPLHELLPPEIGKRLQEGFRAFGQKMKGYLTNEALIVGVESRTSSPVRIPRDSETLQHPQISNLYPCAEGAGYAGGIVSAAIDGQRCAEAIAKKIG